MRLFEARCGHRLPLDDRTDLQHGLLVASCRRGTDRLAVAEQVFALVDRLEAVGVPASGTVRPATAAVHRRLVAQAREILAGGRYASGLNEIAARVNTSPHHLSRVFRRVTGETMTGYRNRMRVRAVLADVQDGEDSLRTLAARYGFADQAHLTRPTRRQPGPALVPRISQRLSYLLDDYRLVMIDQRGTGAGAVDCPRLQAEVGASDVTHAAGQAGGHRGHGALDPGP